MNKQCRIEFIDVARGIGILSVIVSHWIRQGYGVVENIFSWHMPLFFVLTGMLFYYNQGWRDIKITSLLQKKAITLLYPYITFSCISILYDFVWDSPGGIYLTI